MADSLPQTVSLGVASDLLVMRGLSVFEEHADRIVMRTPAEPTYWSGNCVIFRGDRVEAAQAAQVAEDFPDAGHSALGWDAPDMTRGPGHEELEALGYEIDLSDVLVLERPVRRAPSPQGIHVRVLELEDDWAQASALQVEIGMETFGIGEATYGPYIQARVAGRRWQAEQGWCAWFGAFEGDELVGDLGIFLGERVARYQSVETKATHRGRGICPALLTAAADWAAERAPAARPVIVANAESVAGRIYRRQGFALAERLISALKQPAH